MVPPTTTKGGREWTNFEKHTLLCLLAKGKHLEVHHGKKSDDENRIKQHAYLNVATELNDAIHGITYKNDLDKKDVARMIDKMLAEKKGVIGRGSYMERQAVPRITRGLKRLWERPTKFDYDGSVAEWKLGRKEAEQERLRIANGGAPAEDTVMVSVEDREVVTVSEPAEHTNPAEVSRPVIDLCSQADTSASATQTRWRGNERVLASQDTNVDQSRRIAATGAGQTPSQNMAIDTQSSNVSQRATARGPPIPSASLTTVNSSTIADRSKPVQSSRGYYNPTLISSLIGPGAEPEEEYLPEPASHGKQSKNSTLTGRPSQAASVAPQNPVTGFANMSPNLPQNHQDFIYRTGYPPQLRAPGTGIVKAMNYSSARVGRTSTSELGPTFNPDLQPIVRSGIAPASNSYSSHSGGATGKSDNGLRLAQGSRSELASSNHHPQEGVNLPAKPTGTSHGAVNPARRAMMEADATDEHIGGGNTTDKSNTESGNRRPSMTSANMETLPFNRMSK